MRVVVIGGSPALEQLNTGAKQGLEPTWIGLESLAYWFARVEAGGEMLAPGEPSQTIRVVNGWDIVGSWQDGFIGEDEVVTIQKLLEALRDSHVTGATFTWVSDDFLKRQGVCESDIPLWFPGLVRQPESALTSATGILDEVIRQCRHRFESDPASFDTTMFMSSEREHEILRRWHQLTVPYRSGSIGLG